MIATNSACQVCGWEFYGYGYAGEACSQECFEIIEARNVDKHPEWADGEDGEVWPAHGHVWDIGGRCCLCSELAIDAAAVCPNI